MADATKTPPKSEETKPAGTPAPGPTTPPAQQSQPLQVDDTALNPTYANFCRVTGTPEEIILDFGLNAEPFGRNTAPVKLTQRLVANFYTAKRLLMALQVAIQRHEQTFGVLETDVNKRVQQRPSGSGPAAGGGGTPPGS